MCESVLEGVWEYIRGCEGECIRGCEGECIRGCVGECIRGCVGECIRGCVGVLGQGSRVGVGVVSPGSESTVFFKLDFFKAIHRVSSEWV